MATGFRSTLKRLASEADPAERDRLAGVFASQIETALDAQGGNMQMALWNVEESVSVKFDHIHEQIGNNNTLQSAVLEAVGGLRGDVQNWASEFATRLGKLEQRMDAIEAGHQELLQMIQDGHNAE